MLRIVLLSLLLLLVCSCDDPESEPAVLRLDGERFLQEVFTIINKYRGIPYGTNTTQSGMEKELVLDFYEPRGDELEKRPLIILLGGFGFVINNRGEFDPLADQLARLGYAVAVISYRLDDRGVLPVDTLTSYDNIIKARADLKTAIRFFRKDAGQDNRFRIDPDRIFGFGYSAGAFACLAAAYLNDWEEGSPLVRILLALNGGLEGDGDHQGYPSHLNGLVNLSGALIDAGYLDPGEPSLLSVHGIADGVVPFCGGNVSIPGMLQPFKVEGACRIHEVALVRGINNKLVALDNGGHDALFDENICRECWLEIVSFLYYLK